MLTCVPKSICSRDFRVTGGLGGAGSVCFSLFSEQGTISKNGARLKISKNGWFRGRWSLAHNDRVLAEARKPSIFSRSMQIQTESAVYVLKPRSLFTRGFNIICQNRVIGRILPKHAWTRRAEIKCDSSVPEEIQLFAFWLVAMIWMRAARNHNGSATTPG